MNKNEAQRDKGEKGQGEDKIYGGYCKGLEYERLQSQKDVAEFILRGTMTKKFTTLTKNIKAQIKSPTN